MVLSYCAAPRPASAYSCSITATNVVFGSVDVLAGAAVDVTATLNLSCKNAPHNTWVRNCVSIDGGSAYDATSREMIGPGSLRFQLYSDAARTVVWGSWPLGLYGGGYTWDAFSTSSSFSASTTVYARILAAQQSVPPGSYTSTLNLSSYANTNTSACPFTGLGTSSTSFAATATVPATCRVSATNLNFGTVATLTGNIDTTNSVSPACTNGTPYNVGLDKGLYGTSVTTRQMSGDVAVVNYSLFQNAARTRNWGNMVGTDTVAGTGTGSAQNLTVYGRIPPQTTPAPGTYNDTIVVTVTY